MKRLSFSFGMNFTFNHTAEKPLLRKTFRLYHIASCFTCNCDNFDVLVYSTLTSFTYINYVSLIMFVHIFIVCISGLVIYYNYLFSLIIYFLLFLLFVNEGCLNRDIGYCVFCFWLEVLICMEVLFMHFPFYSGRSELKKTGFARTLDLIHAK